MKHSKLKSYENVTVLRRKIKMKYEFLAGGLIVDFQIVFKMSFHRLHNGLKTRVVRHVQVVMRYVAVEERRR